MCRAEEMICLLGGKAKAQGDFSMRLESARPRDAAGAAPHVCISQGPERESRAGFSSARAFPDRQKPICAAPLIVNVKHFANRGVKCQILSLTSPACHPSAQTCSVVISSVFSSSDISTHCTTVSEGQTQNKAPRASLDLHPNVLILAWGNTWDRICAWPSALGMGPWVLGEVLGSLVSPVLVPLPIKAKPALAVCPVESCSSRAPSSSRLTLAPGFLGWFCPRFSLG